MNRCPNCNAELTSRPCPSCGWPQTTQPSDAERARVKRQLAAHTHEDSPQSGCCGGCAPLVAVLAALAALGFYKVGEGAGWTSDGPAMLFVYLGVGGFGLLAAYLLLHMAKDTLRRDD